MSKKREQLFPLWMPSLIALVLIIALASNFPREGTQARGLSSHTPSELSVAYLEAWLRVEPDSPEYLESLGDQYLQLGRWKSAMLTAKKLESMGGSYINQQRALMLEIKAVEQLAYEQPSGDNARNALMSTLKLALERSEQYQWDVLKMQSLAKTAAQVGDSALMGRYYAKLAAADAVNASHWQQALAQAALAQQDYDAAARAYFAAYDAASDIDLKRHYFIAALKVLVSNNQVSRACDEATQRLDTLSKDPETLRYLIDLARQASRVDLVTRYARALLDSAEVSGTDVKNDHAHRKNVQRLSLYGQGRHQGVGARSLASYGPKIGVPRLTAYLYASDKPRWVRAAAETATDMAARYELVFNAFVESNQLDDAEKAAQTALDAGLDTALWAHRLAKVALWNNHPQIALGAWLTLARASDDTVAWGAVLKLAPQLDDSDAYLEAWKKIAAGTTGTGSDVERGRSVLFTEYMKIGHWNSALNLADQLSQSDDTAVRQHGLLMRAQATEQLAYQFSEQDPRRAAGIVRFTRAINDAANYEWDVPTLKWLAQKARELGDREVMVGFYQKLARVEPDQTSKWQGLLGDVAAEQQSYEAAAQAYFAAQQAASTLDEKRRYFLMAIKILVAGDQVDRACSEGEQHVGELEQDPETLRFLLNTARQANRQSLMARYARALIAVPPKGSHSGYFPKVRHPKLQAQGLLPEKIIYRDGLAGALALAQQRGARIHLIATRNPRTSTPSAQRSEDYESAYAAFLDSKLLDEAEALAERALAENMDVLIWAPRVAQVAQWNNQPKKALKYWLQYAQASGNQNAWATVLKLAMQLDDNLAYLLALQQNASRVPSDMTVLDELVQTYEKLGRPESAMSYLKAHARGALRQPMLERYAAVAERSGHDEVALKTYTTLLAEHPMHSLYAMHIASLHYEQGNLASALAALRRVSGKADDRPETAPYWSLYGQLAQLTNSKKEAALAYKHLLATGRADVSDLDTMTYFYEGNPIDAGRIAEMSYRKDGSKHALEAALTFYTQAGAFPRVQKLLGELTLEQRVIFERSVSLLSARAEYYLKTGQWHAALEDYQHAVRLPGAGDQTKIAYLWALVDFGTDAALRLAVQQWRPAALINSGYWGAFAAAQMRLKNPAEAVQFLRLQYRQSGQDPLWLMTLADAEAAAGHTELAWSYRREAFSILEKKAAAMQPTRDSSTSAITPERIDQGAARIALSQIFASGDVSQDLLIHLLRQEGRSPQSVALANSMLANTAGLPSVEDVMVGTTTTPSSVASNKRVLDEAAKSVVLAWAVSGEHNELARAWLAREYANRLLQPPDAAATLALAANDTAEIGRQLEVRGGAGIPLETRIPALMRTGQTGAAETLVFQAAQGAPENDAINDLMAETLLPDRPAWGVDTLWSDSKPLKYVQTTLAGGLKLTGRLGLGFEAIQRNQRSTNEADMPWVPAFDREYSLALHDTTIDRDLAVKLGYRDAMTSFVPLSLSGEFNRQGPFTVSVMLGVNQFTDLTPQLQVGAVQDLLRLGVQWNPESRWFLGAAIDVNRLYSQSSTFQDRTYIGRGVHMDAALGYRIRSAYPDWSVRLTLAHGTYHASDRTVASMAALFPGGTAPLASDLIPQNFTQYGLMVGLGNSDKATYSRTWRPFMDAGMVHDNHDGWGPQILVGLGGPIVGRDRLQFHVLYEKATQGSSQRTMQVGLSYRMLY